MSTPTVQADLREVARERLGEIESSLLARTAAARVVRRVVPDADQPRLEVAAFNSAT